MKIGNVQRVSAIAPSNTVTSATTTSKTLQSQLQMKQQNLKDLSYDTSLSKEEKAKQEQAYKKEIEELKRKLEQLQQKQEEASKKTETDKEIKVNTETDVKKLDKTESDKEVTEADTEEKTEIKELSLDDAQKILDDNFTLKETMIEQGAAYDKENYVRRLTSEIKQDQLLNTDTSSKEEKLEELLTQEDHWQNAKAKQMSAEPAPMIHPDVQVSIS